MATITPVSPAVNSTVIAGTTPTASDTIPVGSASTLFLLVISSTGTPQISVVDPTSQAPVGLSFTAGGVAFPALTAGQARVAALPCARFRDANGNVTINTTSPANTTLYAFVM